MKKGSSREQKIMVTLLETEKTRDVLGLSVRGTLNIVDTDKKNRKGEFIYKPEAIVFYKELKMGIDLSDQLASYLTVLRRLLRWYR
ncbi:hypothetical protein ILUMI_16346 [Ignelater luminosus]|uniref:Uncharacterized protein n=1 Tax=Ignelater luminosus TaxID=2038154 RepID=A0A8K0G623_IGNLU|nr:hypothetical protein ILUMI_16346 [Ignelater luminosus]